MELSEEEKQAELAATQAVKEEEIRSKVIEEFGFDEVDDAERIDKAVAKDVESHKKLSAAIGQKITYRKKVEELTPKVDPLKSPEPKAPATEDVSKVVARQLDERELDSMEFSDDIKKEIQRIATVQNISVKQASRDLYIVFKVGEWKKEEKNEAATISRTNKSGPSKKSFSADTPPEVNMATPEGRKSWDEYLEWMKQQGN